MRHGAHVASNRLLGLVCRCARTATNVMESCPTRPVHKQSDTHYGPRPDLYIVFVGHNADAADTKPQPLCQPELGF